MFAVTVFSSFIYPQPIILASSMTNPDKSSGDFKPSGASVSMSNLSLGIESKISAAAFSLFLRINGDMEK